MRFLVMTMLILLTSGASAQEVLTCDSSSSPISCSSSTGASSLTSIQNGIAQSIPLKTTENAEKIIVGEDAGNNVSLSTVVNSKQANYWISLEKDPNLNFTADLSTKVSGITALDVPQDSSNIILTGGIVNSINLNISGYAGNSSKDFAHICADDISAGTFGEESLAHFISRRQNDPNLAVDACDDEDILWTEEHVHDSFCPAGTTDIKNDNQSSPTFNVTRLAPKNKCKLLNDQRQCLIHGNRFQCRITANFDRIGAFHQASYNFFGLPVNFGGFGAAGDPSAKMKISSLTSASHSGKVNIALDTWQETVGPTVHPFCMGASVSFFGHSVCIGIYGKPAWRENWHHTVILEYADSTFDFPSDQSNAAAIASQCQGFIDNQNDITLYTPLGEVDGITRPMPFSLSSPVAVNDVPNTSNLLCTSYAEENYPERNVLAITTEPNLDSQRHYEYVDGECPEGSVFEAKDQLHFNSSWTDTYSCEKGNCPNTNFSYIQMNYSEANVTLLPGQLGADHGRADVFVYDVNSVSISNASGDAGSTGGMNLAQPVTKKYCVNIKDFNNASDIHSIQAQIPSVTVNEINYKLYQINPPASLSSRIYDTESKPYVYKKVGSSVRDWIMQLATN